MFSMKCDAVKDDVSRFKKWASKTIQSSPIVLSKNFFPKGFFHQNKVFKKKIAHNLLKENIYFCFCVLCELLIIENK